MLPLILGGMASLDDLDQYLCPTEFIDCDAAAIVDLARSLTRPSADQTAVALFDWVRDEIKYDPFCAVDGRELYRATAVLERGSGYCVQKAVLLAAMGRAAGIPARLGFADVRNHKVPARMREMMGTDLFVYHGYVEFWLGRRWVKATPAFDQEATQKAGALLVELDGENDALLHPVDPQGQPYIEYIQDRGSFADLPFAELYETIMTTYPIPQWAR